MTIRNINKLYNLVFNNTVLLRLIMGYAEKYKRNNLKLFKSRITLILYKEREYISNIIYSGKEELMIGDLPIGCVLKSVKFKPSEYYPNRYKQINNLGEIIPNGVEELEYGYLNIDKCTLLSELPSSIHTIKNAVYNVHYNEMIPSNITSISFIHCNCPISNVEGNKYLKIPNTLKTLEFKDTKWNNNDKPIVKGDIPEGIEKLSLSAYKIYNLSNDSLPMSINELLIEYNDYDHIDNKSNCGVNFNFMVGKNIKKLRITRQNVIITPESNLWKCNSLTSISIMLNNIESFLPNSLPCENLTDLTLSNITNTNLKFEEDLIPKSVKNLKLNFSSVKGVALGTIRNSLPNTITSLNINV